MKLMRVTLIFIRRFTYVVLYLMYFITYYMESLPLFILHTWKITLNINFRTRTVKYFRSFKIGLMFRCISVHGSLTSPSLQHWWQAGVPCLRISDLYLCTPCSSLCNVHSTIASCPSRSSGAPLCRHPFKTRYIFLLFSSHLFLYSTLTTVTNSLVFHILMLIREGGDKEVSLSPIL